MKLLNDIPDLARLSFDDSSDESSYDDNDSIISFAFDSSSKSKRVSFCNTIVTNVKYRPVTKHSDKGLLYYTTAETDRFRQIYREERYRCSISKHIQNGGLSLEEEEGEGGEEARITMTSASIMQAFGADQSHGTNKRKTSVRLHSVFVFG